MKRVIRSSTELTNYHNYKESGNPFTYSIHDNGVGNPDNYKAQITEHHPYSEAEYVWARIGYKEPMSIEYIQDGEVIEYEPGYNEEVYSDWRDFFEDEKEYINATIEYVCDILRNYNKDIESIIGYD